MGHNGGSNVGDLLSTVGSTLLVSAIAVAISASIWIGANIAVNQAQVGWNRYQAVVTGFGAFLITAIMSGNRAFEALLFADNDNGFFRLIGFLIIPLLVGIVAAGLVIASDVLDDSAKMPAFAATGAAGGVVLALFFEDAATPGLDYVGLVICAAVGAGIGYAWSSWRGEVSVRTILAWTAVGWAFGAFATGDTGDGGTVDAILAVAPPLGMLAARIGLREDPTVQELRAFDERARRYIFLAPALGFVSIALIIPTLRTIWLSLLDRRSEEFVWFENYVEIFTANEGQQPTFRIDDWANLFTSRLFWIAIILVGLGAIIGSVTGRNRGYTFARSGGSLAPIALGVFLFFMGLFSVLRGTVFNNLWWVFTVTIVSTVLGLAIAVLSDGVRFESIAKSFIFMPMAISFVGATIIWRFMYIARPEEVQDQTGVMNGLWVALGRLSESESWPKLLAVIVLLAVIALMALVAVIGYRENKGSMVGGAIGGALLIGLLLLVFVTRGLGGVAGEENQATILFVQERPWNNIFLMIVLIWIQTGFAMVILSAAIKAVPAEFIEAASVDGATKSQIFWRVTLPQIAPTVGVVTTTIMVLVMKVFDIVKVMTNGQFGTQVLANDMFTRAFNQFNTGLGAALAVVIFVSIVPVMFLNVRRMQKAEV